VNEVAVGEVVETYPQVRAVPDTARLVSEPLDVYAPCALGGALSDDVVAVLSASIVCGAANNQLEHDGIEKLLAERGITYAPDYCVNSGGLIQVADELDHSGFDFDRAKLRAAKIFDTTLGVLERATAEGVPPSIAADREAEQRMRDVGRLRSVWLPR
jgi:valine dehydrogenase (NAD+)